MSIFGFFKLRKKKEQPSAEKITLDNINLFVNNEFKKINEKSEKFRNEIKEIVSHFSLEIKQKIKELKMFNLDNKREEQRLKEVVMTNFYDYISQLEKLIEDLEKVEPLKTKEYIRDIQLVFNRFNKNSRKIYEKATILIGKELAEVRDTTNNFVKEFNKKLASNEENFEKINLIKIIQKELEDMEESKKIKNQIENSINYFNEKIAKIEEKKQLTEKNYEEYKKNDEFKKYIEEQEKIKQENKTINEEVMKLKQDINLKDLAKYFHNDPKKNSLIKKYSEKFSESLKEDSTLEIIMLLKETKQIFDEEKIKALRKKILEQKNSEENTKEKEFNNLLLNIDSELKYEHKEAEREKEKIPRFEKKQKQLLIKIEETARKIWKNFEISIIQ